MSSRRTSWSSEAGSRDSRGPFISPFASPFDDSRAPSRAGSDDDNVNTQTVSEKYNIMPSAGLLLFPEDVEKDDWLHNPDPNDRDRERCDIWNKRGMVNIGGLVLITLGVLVLFIGYPVLYVEMIYTIRLKLLLIGFQNVRQAGRGNTNKYLLHRSKLLVGYHGTACEPEGRLDRSRYAKECIFENLT